MRQKARRLSVDLLLIDTGIIPVATSHQSQLWLKPWSGDLHDGAGLSDATEPNGLVSNTVFESADYDLLTIGGPSSHMATAPSG